jgi:tRNA-Thr(GGU) m(6)t(6)A37 methyltransferase TsaA
MTDDVWEVRPVAKVTSSRTDLVDDDWDNVESSIVMLAPFGPHSLAGLGEFSHVEVVYLFDRVDPDDVCVDARRPRGNPAWPEVGIFAQRAKFRPNRIGISTCELLSVEGTALRVRGLDAIDGTPVLDVKPYMAEFGPRREVRQRAWSTELMAGYFDKEGS